VNALGVAHAIRCFMANYTAEGRAVRSDAPTPATDYTASRNLICDEDILAAARD